MIDFGIVKPGSTLYIPFGSYVGASGASVTLTGLAVTDIEVYKDGSMTQRASDSGYTLLDTDGIDIDGTTGIHGFSVDLSDNTTAGFWAAGSRYWIVVASVTIDSQTVNFPAATFTIGLPSAMWNTSVEVLASQTSFTVKNGPADDSALAGCPVYIHDAASAIQAGHAVISSYTGATSYSIDTSTKVDTTANTIDVSTSSGLADTTQIHFLAGSGSLPAELAEGTTYYVRDRSGNTLKVAATSGGAAIDLTTTGSGTITLRRRGIVTLAAATSFTVAATDNLCVLPPSNTAYWASTAVATPTVTGVPEVDLTHRLGSAVSGAEATSADIADAVWDEAMVAASSVPGVTAAMRTAMAYMFAFHRNKITQTSSQQILYADDGSTAVATSSVSDNGTTATRGEFA